MRPSLKITYIDSNYKSYFLAVRDNFQSCCPIESNVDNPNYINIYIYTHLISPTVSTSSLENMKF